jgi:choline dehydrogenase-like flavoprotein
MAHYDVIIIGASAGGGTLARHLALGQTETPAALIIPMG